MERGTNKSVLIPGNKRKTLLEASRTALVEGMQQAEVSTGRKIETLSEARKIAYRGNRVISKDEGSEAVSCFQELILIIRYMAEGSGKLEDPSLVTVYLTDFETLCQTALQILNFLDTGEKYEIDPDVEKLILEVKVARLKRDKPNVDKMISEILYSHDPGKLAQMSGYAYPYEIIKYVQDKKIVITDAVKTVNREFAAKHKLIESDMEALRAAKVEGDESWNKLWKRKKDLIGRWKTALDLMRQL
jgi:hypothetical protein